MYNNSCRITSAFRVEALDRMQVAYLSAKRKSTDAGHPEFPFADRIAASDIDEESDCGNLMLLSIWCLLSLVLLS